MAAFQAGQVRPVPDDLAALRRQVAESFCARLDGRKVAEGDIERMPEVQRRKVRPGPDENLMLRLQEAETAFTATFVPEHPFDLGVDGERSPAALFT